MGDPHGFEEQRLHKDLLVDGFPQEIAGPCQLFHQPLNGIRFHRRGDVLIKFDLFLRFFQQFCRVGHDPAHEDPPEPGNDLFVQSLQIFSGFRKTVYRFNGGCPVIGHNGADQTFHIGTRRQPEEGKRLFLGDTAAFRAEEGDHLIQQGLGVTHTAIGSAGNDLQGAIGDLHIFRVADEAESAGDVGPFDPAQVEALTTADHGGQHLVHFCGGKDELCVRGRFFNGLEQRVPCVLGKHVHFVNNIDLELGGDGQVQHILAEFAGLFHLGVGGGVDFDHVHIGFICNGLAGGALAAGFAVNGVEAVHRLGKDTRRGSLADPAGTHEKVCVGDPAGHDGVFQGAGKVFLPHHVGELLRSPLSCNDLI